MNRNPNEPAKDQNQRQQNDQTGQRQSGRTDINTPDDKQKSGNPQAQNDPRKQSDQDGRQQQNVDQDGNRKPSQPDSQQQGRDNQQRR